MNERDQSKTEKKASMGERGGKRRRRKTERGKSEVKIWEVEKWGKRNRRRNRDRKIERQKDM